LAAGIALFLHFAVEGRGKELAARSNPLSICRSVTADDFI
jgi:hypothetical protein